MDEKIQEKAEGKTTEEAKAKATAPGIDDPKNRPATEAENKTPSLVEGAILAADELRKENDRKEALLGREEKLQDRKESLNALGGGSPGGTESKPNITPEETASRKRIKAVADASGSAWGKNYE